MDDANMTFKERCEFIDRVFEIMEKLENGEMVVLNESDRNRSKEMIKESNNSYLDIRKFEQLKDVMLVHKTHYAPKNSTIETRMSANVIDTIPISIFNETYNINLRPCRNTLHFSANHEVHANVGGDWNSCKYAIITPLLSIPKDRIKSNCSVDTFVYGPVSLKKGSYILCPKEEVETIKLKNPGLIVVGYEGTCAMDYANALLWVLGYPVAYGDDWGFCSDHQKSYDEVLLNAGYKDFTPHYYTDDNELEDADWNISYTVGILELIINQPELHSIDSEELAKQTRIFNSICYCDKATPGYFNNLLEEIGMTKSYVGGFTRVYEVHDYCISLIDEAKEISMINAPKL